MARIFNPIAADFDLDQQKITNLADPQNSQDAVNKRTLDSDIGSLKNADSDLEARITAIEDDSDTGGLNDSDRLTFLNADSDLGIRIDRNDSDILVLQNVVDRNDSDILVLQTKGGTLNDSDRLTFLNADSDLDVRLTSLEMMGVSDSDRQYFLNADSDIKAALDSDILVLQNKDNALDSDILVLQNKDNALDSDILALQLSFDSEIDLLRREDSDLTARINILGVDSDLRAHTMRVVDSEIAIALIGVDSDIDAAIANLKIDSDYLFRTVQNKLDSETARLREFDSDLRASISNQADVDSDYNVRLVNLENADSDFDSDILALQNKDINHDSDILALRNKDINHDSDILALQNKDINHDSDILALQNADSDLDVRIDGNDSDILALQNADSDLDVRIDGNDSDILALQREDSDIKVRLEDIENDDDGFDSDIKILQRTDSEYGIRLTSIEYQILYNDSDILVLQNVDSDYNVRLTNLENKDDSLDSDILALQNEDSDLAYRLDSDILALQNEDSDINVRSDSDFDHFTLKDRNINNLVDDQLNLFYIKDKLYGVSANPEIDLEGHIDLIDSDEAQPNYRIVFSGNRSSDFDVSNPKEYRILIAEDEEDNFVPNNALSGIPVSVILVAGGTQTRVRFEIRNADGSLYRTGADRTGLNVNAKVTSLEKIVPTDFDDNVLTGVLQPVNKTDVANKEYVDDHVSVKTNVAGGVVSDIIIGGVNHNVGNTVHELDDVNYNPLDLEGGEILIYQKGDTSADDRWITSSTPYSTPGRIDVSFNEDAVTGDGTSLPTELITEIEFDSEHQLPVNSTLASGKIYLNNNINTGVSGDRDAHVLRIRPVADYRNNGLPYDYQTAYRATTTHVRRDFMMRFDYNDSDGTGRTYTMFNLDSDDFRDGTAVRAYGIPPAAVGDSEILADRRVGVGRWGNAMAEFINEEAGADSEGDGLFAIYDSDESMIEIFVRPEQSNIFPRGVSSLQPTFFRNVSGRREGVDFLFDFSGVHRNAPRNPGNLTNGGTGFLDVWPDAAVGQTAETGALTGIYQVNPASGDNEFIFTVTDSDDISPPSYEYSRSIGVEQGGSNPEIILGDIRDALNGDSVLRDLFTFDAVVENDSETFHYIQYTAKNYGEMQVVTSTNTAPTGSRSTFNDDNIFVTTEEIGSEGTILRVNYDSTDGVSYDGEFTLPAYDSTDSETFIHRAVESVLSDIFDGTAKTAILNGVGDVSVTVPQQAERFTVARDSDAGTKLIVTSPLPYDDGQIPNFNISLVERTGSAWTSTVTSPVLTATTTQAAAAHVGTFTSVRLDINYGEEEANINIILPSKTGNAFVSEGRGSDDIVNAMVSEINRIDGLSSEYINRNTLRVNSELGQVLTVNPVITDPGLYTGGDGINDVVDFEFSAFTNSLLANQSITFQGVTFTVQTTDGLEQFIDTFVDTFNRADSDNTGNDGHAERVGTNILRIAGDSDATYMFGDGIDSELAANLDVTYSITKVGSELQFQDNVVIEEASSDTIAGYPVYISTGAPGSLKDGQIVVWDSDREGWIASDNNGSSTTTVTTTVGDSDTSATLAGLKVVSDSESTGNTRTTVLTSAQDGDNLAVQGNGTNSTVAYRNAALPSDRRDVADFRFVSHTFFSIGTEGSTRKVAVTGLGTTARYDATPYTAHGLTLWFIDGVSFDETTNSFDSEGDGVWSFDSEVVTSPPNSWNAFG